MSKRHPHYGSKPPPYSPPQQQWPSYNYQTSYYPTYPYYVAGTTMVPVQIPAGSSSQTTHVTHYVTEERPGTTVITSSQPQVNTVTRYITSPEADVKVISHVATKPVTTVHVIENPVGVDWIASHPSGAEHLTGRAVLGGKDASGYSMWIIRAWHSGNLIVGRLSLSQKTAYVTYDGRAVNVDEIEVLCAKPEQVRWEEASDGNVPPGAIPGGVTADGETLYVGRANYTDPNRYCRSRTPLVLPGKVQPSTKSCIFAYGTQEMKSNKYEVLILK